MLKLYYVNYVVAHYENKPLADTTMTATMDDDHTPMDKVISLWPPA